MAGPGTSVEFLLGSTTLSDLSDRIEFVGALAQSDEDLAQSVRNTQNELEAAQATLEVLQSKARREEAAASEARDAVLASFQEQQDLLAQIEADLNRAEQLVSKKQKSFKAWLQGPAGDRVRRRTQLRADARRLGGHPGAVPGRRAAGVRRRVRGAALRRWLPPAQGRGHPVAERHADRGAVRRVRAVGLQLAGRQRGVRRGAVRHGLQRAPVGVLVELQRPGAGRRRDRVRGRHGRCHRRSTTTTSSSTRT